jgi:RNA polymerase sigma-70 factor (ECF subfamily)
MVDDSTLLDAARSLDPDALGAVFDAYAPLIYKYAMRLCHDHAQADDIVGDVFSQLANQLAAGKGPKDNLRSYLYQMAYHRVVDISRKDKRLVTIETAPLPRSDFSMQEEQEKLTLRSELIEAIRNELTGDQQHVIILRFIEELSLQETAEIMGKDINNIKVIQNRAIGKLRQALNQ